MEIDYAKVMERTNDLLRIYHDKQLLRKSGYTQKEIDRIYPNDN